jgi:DHA2 family methylenomycin A resistance protein-like MFS transporter
MERKGPDYRLVIFLVGLTQLIVTTDFSIVAVALPSIGRQLRVPPSLLSWVISAAALTGGGFLILAGRAADLFGQRVCLLIGLSLFAIGSLGSALAPVFSMLIAARALQGLGAAILGPANFSLINTLVPEGAPRRQAMSIFLVMQGLSLIIGLLIGGFLTTHFGWRAVFALNPPIAVAAILIALKAVPRPPPSSARDRGIDWLGAALIMSGTGLVLLAVSAMGREGWTAPRPLALLAVGLIAFALFFLAESRVRAPLAPLSMFNRRNFTTANIILLLHLSGAGGFIVLLNVYMQAGLKMSAMQSGLGMMPYALSVMLAGQMVAAVMARFSHRAIALATFTVYAVGLALLALLSQEPNYWLAIALGSVIIGLGATTAFMAVMAEATSDIPADQQGAASAVLFTAQQIGVPLGASVALSVLGLAGSAGLAGFRDAYSALAAVVIIALLLAVLTLRAPPVRPAANVVHS